MYYVVGSFSNRGYAQSMIKKHNDLGPAVLVSHVNGDRVYRVAVGPFSAFQKRDVKISIKKSGIIDAWALHIDHEDWKLASPQEFFGGGKPIAQVPESIKTLSKDKPIKTDNSVGEVAEMPTSKDNLGIKRSSVSRQISKT